VTTGNFRSCGRQVLSRSRPATIWWLRTILFLKRSLLIPKAVWRVPSTCRTLTPLTLEPLVCAALEDTTCESAQASLIEEEVVADGSATQGRVSRRLKEHDSAAVFDLAVADDSVKMRLNQEACRREVYTPRRSSQFLAVLKPWEPIRVVLNGKADWPSGRIYYVQDYHVILCGPARSCVLLPVRTFDLQADLV